MTTMISIARVSDATSLGGSPEFRKEHSQVFGEYADVPKVLRDPNDQNQVALIGQVHDLEGLRSVSRSPEGDALMRKHGFIEQLAYFLGD